MYTFYTNPYRPIVSHQPLKKNTFTWFHPGCPTIPIAGFHAGSAWIHEVCMNYRYLSVVHTRYSIPARSTTATPPLGDLQNE